MADRFQIVTIDLRRGKDGLFVATSADLAGVCVVHRDRERIIEDMPNIIMLWFKRNRDMDVEVFWGKETAKDDVSSVRTVAIPSQIAA